MFGGSSPAALAARFTAIAQQWVADSPAERADQARRKLLLAIAEREPATLNQVASGVGRGAPAVSRSVDSLVRAGLIERAPDPANRRRLAMRVSEAGKAVLSNQPLAGNELLKLLARLAPSELRARFSVGTAVQIVMDGDLLRVYEHSD